MNYNFILSPLVFQKDERPAKNGLIDFRDLNVEQRLGQGVPYGGQILPECI